MSRQYATIIKILEDENITTEDLTSTNRGRIRPDLIGDNDIA